MDNVTVQENAFVFCRYTLAILVWLALLLKSLPLLVIVFVILDVSALLKVHRAPLVWLYTNTLGRFIPSADVVLDVHGMRFAHTAGAVMALVCIVAWVINPAVGLALTFAFAVLKTTSALGFCPAYKIYACTIKGGCCAITSRRHDPGRA